MLKTDFMYNYLDHKKIIIQIQSKRQIMKLELSRKKKKKMWLEQNKMITL